MLKRATPKTLPDKLLQSNNSRTLERSTPSVSLLEMKITLQKVQIEDLKLSLSQREQQLEQTVKDYESQIQVHKLNENYI